MKNTLIATAVAFALTGSFAFAESSPEGTAPTPHSASDHGSKMNKQPGITTGSTSRTRGNNAELEGNNGNSAKGSNSLNNNNNLGNGN